MSIAAALEPVARLIGDWEGEGLGTYPTIRDFRYREHLSFVDVGRPFLHYEQRTWSPEGRPMHVETGYLRIAAPVAEFVLALPTGQAELGEGTVHDEETLVLELTGRILNSATAKPVTATQRTYIIEGDLLRTQFDMEAVGQPMGRHLESVLHRRLG